MSEKNQSWNQAINEWQRRESFWWKFTNRWIRPYSELPTSKKLIGWIWRLGLLVLVPLFFFKKCTSSRLDSAEYTHSLMGGVGKVLGAELNVEGEMVWRPDGPRMRSPINVTWGEGHRFQVAQANVVSVVGIDKGERFSGAWEAESIDIQRLEVVMQGADPARMNAPEEKEAEVVQAPSLPKTRARLRAAGFLDPPSGKWSTNVIRIGILNLYWGKGYNEGELKGANLELRNTGGNWVGTLKGGTISQNWVREIPLKSADVLWDGANLRVTNGVLDLDEGISNFALEVSENLECSIQMEVWELASDHLIPGIFGSYLEGRVRGKITSNGSAAPGGHFKTTAEFEPGEQFSLEEPNFLQSLARITKNRNFKKMPIDEGKAVITTSQGKVDSLQYRFVCKDFAVLEGNVSYENPEVQGTGRLGVEPHVFRTIPEIQEKYFPTTEEDLKWIDLEINGPVDRWMDAKRLQMEADYREAYGELE